MEDFFDNEMGRKILALTKASFKVSNLIPDTALREKIKHQILSVYKIFFSAPKGRDLALGGEKNYSELIKELDVLDSYFFLAGHLNLAKEEHVKSLRNGLLVFKSKFVLISHSFLKPAVVDFLPVADQKPEKLVATASRAQKKKEGEISNRQNKILSYFKENKTALKLADLVALFPDITEKTVRNDLLLLIQKGKISRQGVGNGSHYQFLEE